MAPLLGWYRPRKQLDERGFAGAVGPDERETLAGSE
jgi:hypothetical protein